MVYCSVTLSWIYATINTVGRRITSGSNHVRVLVYQYDYNTILQLTEIKMLNISNNLDIFFYFDIFLSNESPSSEKKKISFQPNAYKRNQTKLTLRKLEFYIVLFEYNFNLVSMLLFIPLFLS